MKKLYTITLMLVMMLTSNLFSQVTLPYSVGIGTGSINSFGGAEWTHKGTGFSPIYNYIPSYIYICCIGGKVEFTKSHASVTSSVDTSVISISPSTNLSIQIDYTWNVNVSNQNVEVWGRDESTQNWVIIESNVQNAIPFSYNGGQTFDSIMVKFTSDITVNSAGPGVTLTYFSISSTTGIETTDISENYNVYSYNKNLVVKSNDFKEYTVTLYNLSGQVVFNKTTNGNDEFTLDVSNGMYIVNVNDGTESFNQKVVIQ